MLLALFLQIFRNGGELFERGFEVGGEHPVYLYPCFGFGG